MRACGERGNGKRRISILSRLIWPYLDFPFEWSSLLCVLLTHLLYMVLYSALFFLNSPLCYDFIPVFLKFLFFTYIYIYIYRQIDIDIYIQIDIDIDICFYFMFLNTDHIFSASPSSPMLPPFSLPSTLHFMFRKAWSRLSSTVHGRSEERRVGKEC